MPAAQTLCLSGQIAFQARWVRPDFGIDSGVQQNLGLGVYRQWASSRCGIRDEVCVRKGRGAIPVHGSEGYVTMLQYELIRFT